MIGPALQPMIRILSQSPVWIGMGRFLAEIAKKAPKDKIIKILVALGMSGGSRTGEKLAEKILGDKRLSLDGKLKKFEQLFKEGKIEESEYRVAKSTALDTYARS